MIPELGHFALIVAAFACMLGAILTLHGARTANAVLMAGGRSHICVTPRSESR